MTLTFLEWAETLPEAQHEALLDFFRSLATATSIVDVNVAAGVVLNFLTGVDEG